MMTATRLMGVAMTLIALAPAAAQADMQAELALRWPAPGLTSLMPPHQCHSSRDVQSLSAA